MQTTADSGQTKSILRQVRVAEIARQLVCAKPHDMDAVAAVGQKGEACAVRPFELARRH